MTQIKSVGAVPEASRLPGVAESKVPKVLEEIKEWQSNGKLSQLTDGRCYMADEKHENVHNDLDTAGGEKHTDSHKNNHTDRIEGRNRDRHTDRGPKPPKKPEPPERGGRDW